MAAEGRDIAALLAPGEGLLWQGRPAPGATGAKKGTGFLRGFGIVLLVLMAGVVWLVWSVADGSGGMGFLWAFLGFGGFAAGMLIWGIPALGARALAATRYGVVRGHALVLLPRGPLQRWPLQPGFVPRIDPQPPHARVVWGAQERRINTGNGVAQLRVDLAFEGLAPDQAEAALAALRAAAL